ncbi:MAG: DinB family protein [Bryobacteraceae bacterium]|nr:DinB family protein [Bryobacteraceae bacterium]
MAEVEPWLRGPIPDVHPLLAPVLFSLEQAREDVARATEGLTKDQLWARPGNAAPVGFHIRHIGRSVDRLMTYLQGRQLDEAQLKALAAEGEPGADRDQLLEEMACLLERAAQTVRALDVATLTEPRGVGRKQLPTTVIGLLVHIAEHTQRHVGQVITTAKVVRSWPG